VNSFLLSRFLRSKRKAYSIGSKGCTFKPKSYSIRLKGYSLVEIIIAVTILALLVGVLVQLLRSGRKESDFMTGKLAARQEARLAFRRMCNEIRESMRMILPDDLIHYDTNSFVYKYTSDNPASDERWGPATNTIFIENFTGEIISYYYFHEPEGRDLDGNGVRDQHQLRRLNMTSKAADSSTRAEIIARGVNADAANPSLFTVARYYPGKQPGSIFIKLSVRERDDKEETSPLFNLVSSVFLRNVEQLAGMR